MTNLACLDADELARWLSGIQVRVDMLRMKVPDEEVELVFVNGRLEVRQAGGVAGVFDGLQAQEIIRVALDGTGPEAQNDLAQPPQLALPAATPLKRAKPAATRRTPSVPAARAAKRPILT
jgi:hypothetical protein